MTTSYRNDITSICQFSRMSKKDKIHTDAQDKRIQELERHVLELRKPKEQDRLRALAGDVVLMFQHAHKVKSYKELPLDSDYLELARRMKQWRFHEAHPGIKPFFFFFFLFFVFLFVCRFA